MFPKFRAWLEGLLTAAAALFALLFLWQKDKRTEDKLKASETARATEHRATNALTDGLAREGNALLDLRRRAKDKRDHFEQP